MRRCDVLVIGAGPAGSQAARHAAVGGADTIFVERRRVVGVPVQCAEHVPLPTLSALPRPAEVIVQRISHLRTDILGEAPEELHAPGAIVRRDLFDQQLAGAAQEAGAELWLRTRAVGWDDGDVLVEGPGGRRRVRARVVIGADGPRSRVRRWTGGGTERFVHAAQVRLPLARPMDHTLCSFRPGIVRGYGWVFPRGRDANVGLGVDPVSGVRLQVALRAYIAELTEAGVLSPGRPTEHTGGLLPVGGMVSLRRGNVVLAGDAAGQCDPITGAGIPHAVLAGELAGQAAAEVVQTDDLDALDEYVDEATSLLGPLLERSRAARLAQESGWQADFTHWRALVRRTWPATRATRRTEDVRL